MRHLKIGLILLALATTVAPISSSAKNPNYVYSVKTKNFAPYWPDTPNNMNTVYRYDAVGRLVFSGTFTDKKTIETTTYSYASNGNMTKFCRMLLAQYPNKRNRYVLRIANYMAFEYGPANQLLSTSSISLDEKTFDQIIQEVFVRLKSN